MVQPPIMSLTKIRNRGSIKANIGHLEAASGLAGLVKSIMVLEKGIIPPNALFQQMNPEIDADALKVQVSISTQSICSLNLMLAGRYLARQVSSGQHQGCAECK